MTETIIKYSIQDIEYISENFTAELDAEIIKKLSVIKKNSVFFKHATPINVNYGVSTSNWRRGNVDNIVEFNPQIFENKITSNLNKLTNVNYKVIKNEIIKIIFNIKDLEIDKNRFIDILFEKGSEEHLYSNIYSKLLAEIIEELNYADELKPYILSKCEIFYTNNLSFEISELETDKSYDDICNINKNKKLILGGIIFISNLFNYKLISYDWVKKYYNGLVKMTKKIDKDMVGMYIDTLCAIISTCGTNLEKHSTYYFKENFLNILLEFSNDKKRLKAKYRFKIKDTIEQF